MKRVQVFVVGGSVTAWCGLSALAAAPAVGAKPAPGKAPAVGAVKAPLKPGAPALPRETVEFFEKEVRPVLADNCYSCHGPKVRQGNLRLDSRAATLQGGDKGPSLDLQAPEKSLFLKAIKHDGLQMPPGRKLSEKQVAALEKWVRMGAPWPGSENTGQQAGPLTWDTVFHSRKQWWSLQPVRMPAVPAVKNAAWSGHPIDRFIQSALEKKGLKPTGRADRRTLVRRLYITLVGLPPTADEVEQFVKDPDPKAYVKLVDKLLASPHFGERWARHWMDVARFGENHGYEWNYEVRDAWRYRDYLIRAFNQDVPYDQFVKEHVAGDLLPNPRIDPIEKINDSKLATAFYRFGEAGHDVFKEIGLDYLDNQIDTLSRGFQAATVSCARCHDHKLDAVSTRDYYALLGILHSSRPVIHTLDAPDAHNEIKQKLQGLKTDIRREMAEVWRADSREVTRYLVSAQATREGKMPADAAGLDAKRIQAWADAANKASALEDPLHAWQAITKPGVQIAEVWNGLAARYQTESRDRTASNAKNFTVLGDFRDGTADGWRVDGNGLRDGFTRSGDFAISPDGDKALLGVLPNGLFTYGLSDRFNGAIQSPDLPADARTVSMEVIGGKQAVIRVVPDFRHLGDAGQALKPERLAWARAGRSDRDERVFVEIATKLDSGRYDRVGKDYDPAKEDNRSYFGVTRVLIHKNGENPRDELSQIVPLFREAAPQNVDEAAARYAGFFQAAVNAWASNSATDEHVRLLNWLLEKNLLTNSQQANARLAGLVRDYRQVEQTIPAPKVVAGLADQGPGFDHPVYLRGDFRSVGDMVPRRYLEVLSSEPKFNPSGSGRLQLAERIVNPKNPLTSRTLVNRVWHWLFGTGIVRSVDDFGHMGELPSHPDLLDYLAGAFSASPTPISQRPTPNTLPGMGWSMKKLIRTLVLTETFQQSSKAEPRGMEVDPENRLLHHFPARRAEAEVIRDSMLAVSGRLDPKLYGASIHPYRPQEKGDRKLWSGPLDSHGRRSVYIRITLMEGPPFLGVFNQPEAKVSQGRRDVTNVPAQALALMNDPFVIQQAQVWADRLITGSDASTTARVERMFLAALGRKPTAPEALRFEKAVQELAELNQVPAGDILKHRDLWKDVAHSVFNLKEFIYVK